MTIFVTDKTGTRPIFKPLGEVGTATHGTVLPGDALVEVKALVDNHAVVEIEATASCPERVSRRSRHGPSAESFLFEHDKKSGHRVDHAEPPRAF